MADADFNAGVEAAVTHMLVSLRDRMKMTVLAPVLEPVFEGAAYETRLDTLKGITCPACRHWAKGVHHTTEGCAS